MSDEDIDWLNGGFGFRHGFPVTDELLTAIGCAALCQSHVEYEIARSIKLITNLGREQGDAITAGLSFRVLSAVLSSLIIHVLKKGDERYKRFENLMGQFQHFEEFRNQLVHSIWALGDNSGQATRSKTTARQGAGVKYHREAIEIDRISAEIDKAHSAIFQLTIFVQDFILLDQQQS